MSGWKLSLRNLSRNKRRNLATGVAIALGFTGMLLLDGYVRRVSNFLRVYSVYASRTGHLAIYHKGGLENHALKPRDSSLTPAEQGLVERALQSVGAVDFFGKELEGSGLVGNGCTTVPFRARGIEPEIDRRLARSPELAKWAKNFSMQTKGRGLWEFSPELGPIALSEGLARTLQKKLVHDEIPPSQPLRLIEDCQGPTARDQIGADANVQLAVGTWAGDRSVLDGEIVAQFSTGFAETDGSAMLVPIARLQLLYETPNVTRYSVWLKESESGHLAEIQSELLHKLQAQGLELDVYPWTSDQISPLYVGTTQFFGVLSGFIAAVLGVLVVLSIFNSLTITVIEREPEIGTFRALGFTRRQIRRMFAGELSGLALVSIGVGGLTTLLAMAGVNAAGIQFSPPGSSGSIQLLLNPSPWTALWVASGILVLTLIATELAVGGAVKRTIPWLLAGGRNS